MTCQDDKSVEQAMGTLLRIGVLLAATTVFLGGCVYLMRHGGEQVDNATFRGIPQELQSPAGVIRLVLEFRGRGLIQLGLMFLVAIPVARVLFSTGAFALQRDWVYVALTLVVLAVLIGSLVGAS